MSKHPKGYFNGVIRTPEAIRADIDRRAEETPVTNTPGRKRPITVTVAGERGSGKTTLIAIVTQALRGSGHLVDAPKHVPNATEAVRNLHEQFDVTFVEAERTFEEAVQAAVDLRSADFKEARSDLIARNRDLAQKLQDAEHILNDPRVPYVFQEREDKLRADLEEQRVVAKTLLDEHDRVLALLEESRAEQAERGQVMTVSVDTSAIQGTVDEITAQIKRVDEENAELRRENDALIKRLDALSARRFLTNEAAERAIADSFEEIRQATVLESARNELRREIDKISGAVAMHAKEIGARRTKARDRMFGVLTGGDALMRTYLAKGPAVAPAIETARRLAPETRLEIANAAAMADEEA